MKPARPPGPRLAALGRLLALLALLGQIAFGAAAPAQATPEVSNPRASTLPICHTDAPGTAGDGAPVGHGRHGMQCALCPACHALAAGAVLPVPSSALPAPRALLAYRHALPPPARAPPAAAVFAATYPTGPPHLA